MIDHPEFPCPREELSILVKANRHHPVCGVECFFNPVAVVHIDVDIQYAIMIPDAVVKLLLPQA